MAQVWVNEDRDARIELGLDHADAWPRYYFDRDRGKLECEAWMKRRGQWCL